MLGPIFAREFLTVPRSDKHYTAHAAAFGSLWALGVTAWLATTGLNMEPTLGEAARFGRFLFQIYVFVALVLVIFFAALTAAGAVAREKDRRTFVLLLLTDLRDSEIVLGKMLGSLLPIGLLLLGLLPVLAMVYLQGGLVAEQVVQAWLALAASGFAAGSLGAFVALWRDRTHQSLALSVLGIVLYFCLTRAAVAIGGLITTSIDWPFVMECIDPISVLLGIVEPPIDDSPLIPAAYIFTAVMFLLGIGLNLLGIWRLRVWNPGREPIIKRETKEDDDPDEAVRARAHAAPGTVRNVWANPILWREIRTRAYGNRPFLIKLLYLLVVGLIAYGAFNSNSGARADFQAAYGLLPVCFLSFLLVVAQSVTAITSERDVGALDLLLVTDLSPREFIFGKLLGVLYNVKEYLLPPFALVITYGVMGWLATPPLNRPEAADWMNAESTVAIFGGLLFLFAFVLVLGVFVALRQGNSRQAIQQALGTVFFLTIGTLVCIYLILINGGSFEYQFLSFSLFLIAGIGGLFWVLSAERPAPALTLASNAVPIMVFYCVTNVLVAKPGSVESAPALVPFLVIAGTFGFSIMAMLIPLLSEFDVALGRTRLED